MEFFAEDAILNRHGDPTHGEGDSWAKIVCERVSPLASQASRMFIMGTMLLIGRVATEVSRSGRLTGTTTEGVFVNVRGCDLWEFHGGKVVRKDSFWKIVEQ